MITYEISKMVNIQNSLNQEAVNYFILLAVCLVGSTMGRNVMNIYFLRKSSVKIHGDIVRYILYSNENYLK